VSLRQPPSIDALGGGGFRIGGVRWEGSVLIVDDAVSALTARDLAGLSLTELGPVLDADRAAVELLVIGAGPAPLPPARAIGEAFAAERIGLDVLSTAEACRLYNLLAREGRRVAAALIAV